MHSTCQPGLPRPQGLSQPGRSGLDGGFPEHEIHGIALERRHLHAGAGLHSFLRAAGELAVAGKAGHLEQHMARRHIGMATIQQLGDQELDVADVLGDAGLPVRWQHMQSAHVGLIRGNRALRDRANGNPCRGCRRIDLVIHIGEVAHIDHLPIGVAKQAHQHIKDHCWPGIPNVGQVIDGGAAHIQRHPVRLLQLQGALAPAQAVVELDPEGAHQVLVASGSREE